MLQGHALFTRQAGSTLPCPVIDLFKGFNGLMAVGFGITPAPGQTFQQAIAGRFGSVFGELVDCALGDAVLRMFSAVCVASKWLASRLALGHTPAAGHHANASQASCQQPACQLFKAKRPAWEALT